MEISLLTAFLGGILALLSPCGALLLPAFFASVVGQRMRLVLHGGVFYLGLVVTLVPLGLGLGAIGDLLTEYRSALIIATSIILVVLGLAQAAGFGFDMSKVLPGAGGGGLQHRAHQRSGFVRTILLGAASGVAGFCAGPILGAILTLAVAQGNSLTAGAMLAVYGLGMVVPLIILAGLWHKLSPRALGLIRGRGFRFLGRELHTTSVVTGLLIAVVGVVFWTTNGLVTAPSLVPTDIQRSLQSYSSILANPFVDVALIGVVVVGLTTWWAVHRTRKQAAVTASTIPEEH